MKGELLAQVTPPEDAAAETALRTAVDIARRQSAKLWELKAATSLARLLLIKRRQREAYGLLEPIHAWFGSGRMFPDLADAGRLLVLLSQYAPADA